MGRTLEGSPCLRESSRRAVSEQAAKQGYGWQEHFNTTQLSSVATMPLGSGTLAEKRTVRTAAEEAFVKVMQAHGIANAFGIICSATMPTSDFFPTAGEHNAG